MGATIVFVQKWLTLDYLSEKKFSSQPLVPIGCMITVYYLGSGIKSFYNRDAQRSQKMMRARVAAQFMTLAIFVAYTGFGEFDFTIAPMYQRAKQHEQALTADKEGETKEAK